MDGGTMQKQLSEQRAQLRQRIRALRDALTSGLVERDVAIRLALIAMLAGEHLLLLGPPGTAKSLVARRLLLACAGARYFERLLTRFTVPEELFGPLSIKGLEEDRYERLTASYLPTASIAFLDEVFKANSAILNSLLTLLNEREFDNGTRRERTPLLAVIGASNELGEAGELDALYDRFLVRLHVPPVSKEAFGALLSLRGQSAPDVPQALRLTTDELGLVQLEAEEVTVPAEVATILCELRDWCVAEKIAVSDRRWRKIVKLLQVAAFTDGRHVVSVWDCWLLQHCVWSTPADREKVFTWYAERVGTSAAMDPARLTRVVAAWERKLDKDKSGRSQMRDERARLLYVSPTGKRTHSTKGKGPQQRDGKPLYLAPAGAHTNQSYSRQAISDRTNSGRGYTEAELNALQVYDPQSGWEHFQHWSRRAAYLGDSANNLMAEVDLLPAMEPMRHKDAYVSDCVAQVCRIEEDVAQYEAGVRAQLASLESEIRDHLWVSADFAMPATRCLNETLKAVVGLRGRISRVRDGLEQLPRELASAEDAAGDARSLTDVDEVNGSTKA